MLMSDALLALGIGASFWLAMAHLVGRRAEPRPIAAAFKASLFRVGLNVRDVLRAVGHDGKDRDQRRKGGNRSDEYFRAVAHTAAPALDSGSTASIMLSAASRHSGSSRWSIRPSSAALEIVPPCAISAVTT